jgi:hypothetical protein
VQLCLNPEKFPELRKKENEDDSENQEEEEKVEDETIKIGNTIVILSYSLKRSMNFLGQGEGRTKSGSVKDKMMRMDREDAKGLREL